MPVRNQLLEQGAMAYFTWNQSGLSRDRAQEIVRLCQACKGSILTTHLGMSRENQQGRHAEAVPLNCFLLVVGGLN